MPRRKTAHRLFALALCLVGSVAPRAQSPATPSATPQQTPGTLAGRVARAGGERHGLGGITLLLLPGEYGPRWKAVARATTDAEGRYRFASVPPGRYNLLPFAPAFIVEDVPQGWPPGRPVTISPGESIEDFDFTLTRGAVITGRVTDADGQPVVEQQIELQPLDERTAARVTSMYRSSATDDRGVYRLFGLPAGRYRVSVGQDANMSNMGGPGLYYPRTFHPSAAEASRAKVIEVAEGGEAEDVDITLGRPAKLHKATGRVVYAATGRPAAGVRVVYGVIEKDSTHMGAYGSEQSTNARGEFTLQTLWPGQRYGVFVAQQAQSEWYSDVTTFDVADSDVSGLEVKLRRGATMSGTVVIEGAGDRATVARLLSSVQLYAGTYRADAVNPPVYTPTMVNADGTFRATGLRPGRAYLHPIGPTFAKGLSLLRVEHEGVERPEGLDVSEGAEVSGVRVVFGYGRAVVRGQVTVKQDGRPATFPEGARVFATARRAGAQTWQRQPVEVDARGHFMLDAVPSGQMEVNVFVLWPHRQARATQVIFVPESGEVTVELTLDLAHAEKVNN
ncbi:MAG TPA: carboxypeptidase-like regulatory domain-containing protein [Pyrinomonadaceae bacterium]|nr:carboxypeptidase-like regulatory domain-containing protein [Pyrinomonadaceae bacterium]